MFSNNRRIDIYINGVYETSTIACKTKKQAKNIYCELMDLSPVYNKVRCVYPVFNSK